MRLLAIPFIGLGALVLGGVLGILSSKMLGHTGHKTGAVFGCCSFTNIGAIGVLICIVFIGLALRFSNDRSYAKECITTMTIKFLTVPAVATSAAVMLGFDTILQTL